MWPHPARELLPALQMIERRGQKGGAKGRGLYGGAELYSLSQPIVAERRGLRGVAAARAWPPEYALPPCWVSSARRGPEGRGLPESIRFFFNQPFHFAVGEAWGRGLEGRGRLEYKVLPPSGGRALRGGTFWSNAKIFSSARPSLPHRRAGHGRGQWGRGLLS